MTSLGLSIVVPTLNCANDLPAHIASMKLWLDLADEIVVVDSDSEDGTLEIIRESLPHPGLRILTHPRGLYQSWNHAISQTTGKWIYISTIGDTITREQLEHLLEAGEALNADVVVSSPEFIFDEHITVQPPTWPIPQILEFHCITQPTLLDPLAAFIHESRSIPDAILGSSASNLYRGNHLRARPFPTEFRMAGDTGWSIRYALETRFCFTRRVGSVFRFHSDTYAFPDHDTHRELASSLRDECMKTLIEWKNSSNSRILNLLEDSIIGTESYNRARAAWGLARRASKIPWYFRPSAIQARKRRNKLREKMHVITRLLELELRNLPVLTASLSNYN
jgi:glycosyltransferase involved in cell wall biosynthesis